jgi:hypothetical protein
LWELEEGLVRVSPKFSNNVDRIIQGSGFAYAAVASVD